jgi:Na+/H+ antiporter NhaD/arsenite permease-like protein
VNAAVTILVFAAVFTVIYRGTTDRRAAVLAGAAVILGYGLAAGFFSLEMAIDAIYFETLALIFGMSAISALLARSGLFSVLATRLAMAAAGNGWWVLLVFSLATYGFSLLVNNLAAMVVILPVTLAVCRQMRIDPVPILVAEIIASNLGGASTMIGDFPNMIISSAGGLGFLDFIGGMMVPSLMLLAAMFGFFQWRSDRVAFSPENSDSDPGVLIFEATEADERLVRMGLTLLALTLAGFLVADFFGLRPGWIAFSGGVAALVFGGTGQQDRFADCGGPDVLFFGGLFVMVGGLSAAGVLDGFVWLIETISGGWDLGQMLALMWIAALSTIFLNAGATTAFFVPVAGSLNGALSDPTVWWALSLGILAGSSAALTGATAGPLAASHLDRFIRENPEMKDCMADSSGLTFRGYLNWGMPVMGIFLVLSSVYIALVAK